MEGGERACLSQTQKEEGRKSWKDEEGPILNEEGNGMYGLRKIIERKG